MTTIAFSAGVMAADSKFVTEDHQHLTRGCKIYRLASGALLGTAGDGDSRDVVDIFNRVTPKRLPSREVLAETRCGFDGLLVFPKGPIFFVAIYREMADADIWGAQINVNEEPFCAIGSGAPYAIAAMACGKSAAEAVEIACRYDGASGPPVISVSLIDKKRGKK